MMKIGSIGYGNMASAILSGAVASKLTPASEVMVYDPDEQKQAQAKQQGMNVAKDLQELTEHCECIVLAVKPNIIKGVLNELSKLKINHITFISIAAGITIETIENLLCGNYPVVRTMPNTPLLLGKGTTALCKNKAVSDKNFDIAKSVFACSGTVYEVEENQMDYTINLNGSAPAYLYHIAHLAASYAEKESGIPYKLGLSMFSETLVGASAMLMQTGKTPQELINEVSSPGGATIAAFAAFEKTGLDESYTAGMQAAVNRAKEMGAQK